MHDKASNYKAAEASGALQSRRTEQKNINDKASNYLGTLEKSQGL
jgi:hypothetical protein